MKDVVSFFYVAKWFARDLVLKYMLRYSGYLFLWLYFIFQLLRSRIAYGMLLKSSRYSYSRLAGEIIIKTLKEHEVDIELLLKKENIVSIELAAVRSIVLKNPDLREGDIKKGILLIKFTDTFSYYCCYMNNLELLKYFDIVLEPSWAGYALPEILYWTRFNSGQILVESSEVKDYKFIKDLDSVLKPVTFGSSDWVDYRIFKPLGLDKIYDSVYVANFNYIKRHHVYFRALKNLKGSGYRAALVCGKWGANKEEVEALIKFYGINDMLDLHVGLTQTQLNGILNKSKVNVLMSLKEGSNRSVFEGLFAGVPGIILKDNIGVNKLYINNETGMQVSEGLLTQALLHFSSNWVDYDTRKWAMSNISPNMTTEKMVQAFGLSYKEYKGTVAIKVNKPEAKYMDVADTMNFLSTEDLVDLFSKKNKSSLYYKEELECLLSKLFI